MVCSSSSLHDSHCYHFYRAYLDLSCLFCFCTFSPKYQGHAMSGTFSMAWLLWVMSNLTSRELKLKLGNGAEENDKVVLKKYIAQI